MLVGVLALHSFLLLSSITLYEYLGCFQLEAVNNKAALNIP